MGVSSAMVYGEYNRYIFGENNNSRLYVGLATGLYVGLATGLYVAATRNKENSIFSECFASSQADTVRGTIEVRNHIQISVLLITYPVSELFRRKAMKTNKQTNETIVFCTSNNGCCVTYWAWDLLDEKKGHVNK
eukprot:scaffold10470_cov190-Amphora_coffeaeformis.AAC.5